MLVALLGGLIYLIVKKSRENALSEFDFELEDEEFEDEFDESDHHSVYIDLRNENEESADISQSMMPCLNIVKVLVQFVMLAHVMVTVRVGRGMLAYD